MTLRVEHRFKSGIPDDDTLPSGVVKPGTWDFDPHKFSGMFGLLEWEPKRYPVENDWRSLAYSASLDRIVAVSSTGSGNRVMTSTSDADSWLIGTTPAPDKGWVTVIRAEELGLYVAAGQNGIMTSLDGLTWTLETIPAGNGWHGLAWSPTIGLLVAVSWDGHPTQVMTSPNGHAWTLRTTPLNAQWESAVWAQNEGLFYAGADSGTVGNRLMSSANGTTWTLITVPAVVTNGAWYDLLAVPEWGRTYALNWSLGSYSAVYTMNGVDWLPVLGGYDTQWRAMAYSPDLACIAILSSTGRVAMIDSEAQDRMRMVHYAETVNFSKLIWIPTTKKFVGVAVNGVGSRVVATVPVLS